MKDKLLYSGIIAVIVFCISYICFAGEQEELQWKEAYCLEAIQCAQYKIVLSQNELKVVQSRLEVLRKQVEESRKSETKKEEVKK